MKTYWLISKADHVSDGKFCPYCKITRYDLKEFHPLKGLDARNSWSSCIQNLIDPLQFYFCSLHADLRITERLLELTFFEATRAYGNVEQLQNSFNEWLNSIGIKKFRIATSLQAMKSKLQSPMVMENQQGKMKHLNQLDGTETWKFNFINEVLDDQGKVLELSYDPIAAMFLTLGLFVPLDQLNDTKRGVPSCHNGHYVCGNCDTCKIIPDSQCTTSLKKRQNKILKLYSLWHFWRHIAILLRTNSSLDITLLKKFDTEKNPDVHSYTTDEKFNYSTLSLQASINQFNFLWFGSVVQNESNEWNGQYDPLFSETALTFYMHIVLNHSVNVIEAIPEHSLGLYSQEAFEACNRWQRMYFDRQSSKRGGNHDFDWKQQCILRCVRPLFIRNNVPISDCQPPYFAKTFVNFNHPLFHLQKRKPIKEHRRGDCVIMQGQYVNLNLHGPHYHEHGNINVV